MNRDRRNRRQGQNRNSGNPRHNSGERTNNNSNNRQSRFDSGKDMLSNSKKRIGFHPHRAVSQEQIRADEEAIREFKDLNQNICPRCGKPIVDLSSAFNDRESGSPIHFDCALEAVSQNETLDKGDKVVYIGNGRFGVLNFQNIHDMRHFTIRKVIEWEGKDDKPEWRPVMADLYSKVK